MNIYVYNPGSDFLAPYLKEALAEHTAVGRACEADVAIMVSSTDIYTAGELIDADEDTPLNKDSEWIALEERFRSECAGIRSITLRCPAIIGTGMNGFARELAESIFRGTFFHFKGNDARKAAIHAHDLAYAIATLAGTAGAEGTYNICGGDHPTLHDLAEALAYRMQNKRISTLSTRGQLWLGRILYGKKRYTAYTSTRTFDSSRLHGAIEFRPAAVTDYLRTHVYDENSL